MGQYHVLVNLDKQEFVHPHGLGAGLKQREQPNSPFSTVLHMLIATGSGKGGGDYARRDMPVLGRWAGDKITLVGDYGERGDIQGAPNIHAGDIYSAIAKAHTEAYLNAYVRGMPHMTAASLENSFAANKWDGPHPIDGWTDITTLCREYVAAEMNLTFFGTGWLQYADSSEAAVTPHD